MVREEQVQKGGSNEGAPSADSRKTATEGGEERFTLPSRPQHATGLAHLRWNSGRGLSGMRSRTTLPLVRFMSMFTGQRRVAPRG